MHGDWLRWPYLIFLLPAAVAIIVLLLSGLSGGGSEGDAGDADLGDVGDASGLADLDGGEPGEAGEGEAESSHGSAVLAFFGVGRAPLTLVLGSLMIGWGVFGLISNEMLRPILRAPAAYVLPSLGSAFVGSLLTAKLIAETAARLMPRDESSAITREELVGLPGRVIYPVSDTSGRVHVRDRFRTLHTLPARVRAGSPSIEKGTEILVASMDPEGRYLIVEPLGITTGKA